jgi:pimeloyl-ACP methyl ester carboxylesterase
MNPICFVIRVILDDNFPCIDARENIKRIDTGKCKVSLLSGEYDYSAAPAMTEVVAASIPGCRMQIMQGMGHFPMVENYPAFRPFLLPELDFMAQC